ncbi:MAG: GDP-mannose 4,6-dehydratase [Alphaproteobacteria bacterium]|jgi:UDP-glucuronate 4-epimerase|nr:GDP-mannose 4,6-dehydratase [Alphaproteobacteria bacterium]
MKTILVTGGAGFIGSTLSESLLIDGSNVLVIDSMNDYYDVRIKRDNISNLEKAAKTSGSFKFYENDIRDLDALEKIFSDNNIDNVVHLAARAGVRPSIEDPSLYMDVNVTGTTNILDMCKKYSIKKIAFASSSSVYGALKKGPFSEDMASMNTISPYAASKMAGEIICKTYTNLYDMNIVALRFFTVYGPKQRPDLAINKFASLMAEGKEIPVYGDGSTQRNYTYIDDIVDGIKRAMSYNEKKFEVFNLGGDKTVSLSDLIYEIENAMGKKAIIKRLPEQPGDVPLTHADISKAREILGYEPKVSIKDGLKKFVEWKFS